MEKFERELAFKERDRRISSGQKSHAQWCLALSHKYHLFVELVSGGNEQVTSRQNQSSESGWSRESTMGKQKLKGKVREFGDNSKILERSVCILCYYRIKFGI